MPVWVNFGLLTNLNIGLEFLGLGKFPRHFNISYVKANDEGIRLAGNDASLHPLFWQKPVATIWSVWGMGHWDVSNLEHPLESFGLQTCWITSYLKIVVNQSLKFVHDKPKHLKTDAATLQQCFMSQEDLPFAFIEVKKGISG